VWRGAQRSTPPFAASPRAMKCGSTFLRHLPYERTSRSDARRRSMTRLRKTESQLSCQIPIVVRFGLNGSDIILRASNGFINGSEMPSLPSGMYTAASRLYVASPS
jgi:hypothetical protein